MGNAPLASEDFDINLYAGMEPVQMMFAMRRDLEFKMPPAGITKQRSIIGGVEFERLTWRCDKKNCWYTCTPRNSANLADIQQRHEGDCPVEPRRESLPSGLAEIEKLWREVDDVLDAIKANEEYRGMAGEVLKAYVKGLAFSIVMKDKDLWPTIKDVSRQAMRRWQMRQGQIPFEATPTRHSNSFSSLGTPGGWQAVSVPPSKRAPAKKAAPRKVAPAAPALPATTVSAIKTALASGMFEPDEIATMYSVTISQVESVKSGS